MLTPWKKPFILSASFHGHNHFSTTLKGIPFCPGPQFSSVAQSCPNFCNLWTAALQASLSITNSWSLLKLNKPRQHIKKQRHYFANKGPSSKSYGFPSSHVWMWELDYKESWAPKIWCFWTVVLEKTLLRVPWTARRSNQSILKEIGPEYSLEGLMLKLKL